MRTCRNDSSGVFSEANVTLKRESLYDAYDRASSDSSFDVADYRRRHEECLDDLEAHSHMGDPIYALFRQRINGNYDPRRERELFADFVERNILAAKIIESEEGSEQQSGLARELIDIEQTSFHSVGEISLYMWSSYFVF